MINVSEPLVTELDVRLIEDAARSGWISSAGRFIDEFEQGWAEYCGRSYGVAVSSGTAALQVAVTALDLNEGDEVIMPTFTIISCALAVVQAGGVPVLVDCDPRTWCMDVAQVEAKVSERTRAIMPVHIYGHPVDMDPLLDIAARHNLAIIEDAAEAHGARYQRDRGEQDAHWAKCGSFGTMSCFSFYANKLITTGEGGMILTDDPSIAATARSLRNLCFEPGRRFRHERLGFNFRLTNLQAALGVAQLSRIEEIVERKRWLGQTYSEHLGGLAGVQLPVEEPWAKSVYWMYGVVIDETYGPATAVADALRERHGVDTRPFFLGMHQQPALRHLDLSDTGEFPVADRIAEQGLYLPSGVGLTEEQVAEVCESVRSVLTDG